MVGFTEIHPSINQEIDDGRIVSRHLASWLEGVFDLDEISYWKFDL